MAGSFENEGVPVKGESSPDKGREQEMACREFCAGLGQKVFAQARRRVREEGDFTK